MEQPGTWGIPGGAIGEEDYFNTSTDEELSSFDDIEIESIRHNEAVFAAWNNAFKESEEELGLVIPDYQPFDNVIYKDRSFTYTTFLVRIPEEDCGEFIDNIKLNWENDDFGFFPVNDLPKKLHFGVKYIIQQRPQYFKD